MQCDNGFSIVALIGAEDYFAFFVQNRRFYCGGANVQTHSQDTHNIPY